MVGCSGEACFHAPFLPPAGPPTSLYFCPYLCWQSWILAERKRRYPSQSSYLAYSATWDDWNVGYRPSPYFVGGSVAEMRLGQTHVTSDQSRKSRVAAHPGWHLVRPSLSQQRRKKGETGHFWTSFPHWIHGPMSGRGVWTSALCGPWKSVWPVSPSSEQYGLPTGPR